MPLGAFDVNIDPVSAGDSGDYVCLVNNRRRPNAVVRLLVQGGRRRPTKVCHSRMAKGKTSMDYTKTLGRPLITAI